MKSVSRSVGLPLNINKIIQKGLIANELEYDRALVADRKLRLLAKEDASLKARRKELRSIIQKYETQHWSDHRSISKDKIVESEQSAIIAEQERRFYEARKEAIRKKLKGLQLTQAQLGLLLGHKSKTHMSELMNGLKPFTLKDLIIIHRLLHIKMNLLIPVFLSPQDEKQLEKRMAQLRS